MVKKRVESLIEREYLERVEDADTPTYRYLAWLFRQYDWRGVLVNERFSDLFAWLAGGGLGIGSYHGESCRLENDFVAGVAAYLPG